MFRWWSWIAVLAHSFLQPPCQGSWSWLHAPPEWRAQRSKWILAIRMFLTGWVSKAELQQATTTLLSRREVFPQHYSRGWNECFDDFGITQEYLNPLCFTAGPLTKAQLLSIQAMASCKRCLYCTRSDWILASNHRKKETRQWSYGKK